VASIPTSASTNASDANSDTYLCFPFFVPTSVMNVLKSIPQFRLSVSQVMPHVEFPIGGSSGSSLRTMIDTCAGLNLGRLQYHKSIYEQAPHLIEKFAYIKDIENLNEFNIGGVDEEYHGTKITAIVVHKTPFRVEAQKVVVAVGLSETAATNTIFGLPFLRASRSVIFLDEVQDKLLVQRFGLSLPITYHIPLRADQAPPTGVENKSSFHLTPGYIASPDLTEFFNNSCAVSENDIISDDIHGTEWIPAKMSDDE
jgi:hypothetical protein